MKIGYVSATDPFKDRKAWSGLIYQICEAIQLAGFEVIWIPYKTNIKNDLWNNLNSFYWSVRHKISPKNKLNGVHSRFDARRYASSIDIDKVNECDYLFFPGGAQICLFLKTQVPVIYLSDANVHQMIDYYWFNIDKVSCRIAKTLEEKASQKSLINIRSSKWALNSVIKDCKCDRDKCFILEFGANIDDKDIKPNSPYEGGRLNILFSGVDWERKGGDIAVETVRLLREMRLDVYLLIVGPKNLQSRYKELNYIEYYGFLNKNHPEEYTQYLELYKKSHLFLLPTKAECAGVVFSEASAFGLPSYTYDTGGTTNYVISDYNGFSFPLGCPPDAFAQRIYNDIKSGKMKYYHDNSLSLYKNKLSWEAWAVRFKSIMNKYIEK